MRLIIVFLLVAFAWSLSSPFTRIFEKNDPDWYNKFEYSSDNDDGAAYVTPLIKQGKIAEARELARVKELFKAQLSYSGFITINETAKSNMYFWFFPAKNGDTKAPILLWLQGGPGGASIIGAMEEHGPYFVDKNGNLQNRPIHWAEHYQIIFIDNPVGAGFSYTGSQASYVKTEDEVGINLFETLTQFFQLFPEYKTNEFYLTGESYAGKYVPAIGYRIHLENQRAGKTLINLVGAAIGNGWSVPIPMITEYGDLCQKLQLIDLKQVKEFQAYQDRSINCIKQKNWQCAFDNWNALMNGDFGIQSLFHNLTGFNNYYNFLLNEEPPFYSPPFLRKENVRKALNVGTRQMQPGNIVMQHLLFDMMMEVEKELVTLMENYKVLIYNGNLDVIVNGALSDNSLQYINWKNKAQFFAAPRVIWKVKKTDQDIAGHVRTYDKFSFAAIRGAGHLVPTDQPVTMLDLLDRFIKNNMPK